MARASCLVCLVSTVSGHCKNALGRGSASSRHITKLKQSTFLFDIYESTSIIEIIAYTVSIIEIVVYSILIIDIIVYSTSIIDVIIWYLRLICIGEVTVAVLSLGNLRQIGKFLPVVVSPKVARSTGTVIVEFIMPKKTFQM
jgi:hypothetical protein